MPTVNADLDALRSSLGVVSNEANTLLRRALDAATFHTYYNEGLYESAFSWPTTQEAIILLASRWYKRRQSPEGVAGWSDLGLMRVVARDPDYQLMIEKAKDMTQAGVA